MSSVYFFSHIVLGIFVHKYALELYLFVSQLEAPSQLERMKYQEESRELLDSLETNLSRLLRQKSEDSLDKFEEYQDRIKVRQ